MRSFQPRILFGVACMFLASHAQATELKVYRVTFAMARAGVPPLETAGTVQAEPGKQAVWQEQNGGDEVRISIMPAINGDAVSFSVSAKKQLSVAVSQGVKLENNAIVNYTQEAPLKPNQTLVIESGKTGSLPATYVGQPSQLAPVPVGNSRLLLTRVR